MNNVSQKHYDIPETERLFSSKAKLGCGYAALGTLWLNLATDDTDILSSAINLRFWRSTVYLCILPLVKARRVCKNGLTLEPVPEARNLKNHESSTRR
jgi:hypothetical protein